MISAKHYTNTGAEQGTTTLPDEIFGEAVNEHAMWLSVRAHLAHQRQGNAAVKNRAAARGGGRKPYRQKGTGHARAGTRRSPLWVGGARAFGPKPRAYDLKLPKKVRRLGIRSALSLAASESRVSVIADLAFEVPKTKTMAELVEKLGFTGTKTLIVLGTPEPNTFLSGRNLAKLEVTSVGEINTYDLLNCENLIITESAVKKLEEATQ